MTIIMEVELSKMFRREFENFPQDDKLKIARFIRHVESQGLTNLTGRNKSSDGFSNDDPNFATKMAYVKKHNLWHYHIGIPNYETATNGEQVSEFVLHYMRYDDHIKIVDMSDHPPFKLPSEDCLE